MSLGYTNLKDLYDREHYLSYDMNIQPISYERWTPFDTKIKINQFNREKEKEDQARIREQEKDRHH